MKDLPIMLSRCDVFADGESGSERPIPVVPKSHDSALDEKQLLDYKDQRKKFRSWLLNFGKNPEK